MARKAPKNGTTAEIVCSCSQPNHLIFVDGDWRYDKTVHGTGEFCAGKCFNCFAPLVGLDPPAKHGLLDVIKPTPPPPPEPMTIDSFTADHPALAAEMNLKSQKKMIDELCIEVIKGRRPDLYKKIQLTAVLDPSDPQP